MTREIKPEVQNILTAHRMTRDINPKVTTKIEKLTRDYWYEEPKKNLEITGMKNPRKIMLHPIIDNNLLHADYQSWLKIEITQFGKVMV
ncbi:hypothetical protein Tsubulata_045103 [Turnera subulata]|uniref:Uncharacterized protein n=1 Tax=Turnera subulata TaxID=218843 RepID=A0A9Q0IZL7_9ROSI|nr:hypothetical protein Tsubulata_045103 [Turnera subulata]